MAGTLTGVFGDAFAKLSFDKEYQEKRRQGSDSMGKNFEGAIKVCSTVRELSNYNIRTVCNSLILQNTKNIL